MTDRKFPEIRFKGYEEGWTERKFADIAQRKTQVVRDAVVTVEYEDIDSGSGALNKDLRDKTIQKSGVAFEPGDVLFGKLRPYLNNWLNPDFGGAAVGDFWVLRGADTESSFLYYLIQGDVFTAASSISSGSKMPRSDWGLVSQSLFATPVTIEEQRQIGSLFSELDFQIADHRTKLAKFQQTKTSLLKKMFPQGDADEPELRLEGFSGTWSRNHLGDFGSVAMNKRIYKEQTSPDGEIPFFKIGTFGKDPDSFIPRPLFEEYKSKYPYPRKGTILVSASGSIGRTIEYMGADEYYQDSNIIWLEHNGRLVDSFLKAFYVNAKWSGIEGTTIKRLYNENMLKTEIRTPSVLEQQAIGALFNELDAVIAGEQQYLQKLKQAKTSLLQKMFA